MDKKHIQYYILSLLGVISGIVLDQYTKALAVERLKSGKPFVIIENIFQLHYLENRGAAFGMFQNQRTFFIISFVIVMMAVLWIYRRLPAAKRFLPIYISGVLLVAGAFGNMIDRLRLGYVVDFFYFELIDFPIFNVADIFVVTGVLLLAVVILFVYDEEEVDHIISLKRADKGDIKE